MVCTILLNLGLTKEHDDDDDDNEEYSNCIGGFAYQHSPKN